MSIELVVTVIIYLIITMYLGFLGYRQTKTAADYLLAGRKTHPVIMSLSYGSTFISTAAIIGFGGLASQMGASLLWLAFFNIFVGIFIAYAYIGKKVRYMSHKINAHTFPELIGKRYKSVFLQRFSGMVILLFMPIYASAVLIGGARFMQTTFAINYEIALLIFTVIITAYVIAGGLKGVMYTDALQGAIMIIGMLILLIGTYYSTGGVKSSHEQLAQVHRQVKDRVSDPGKKQEYLSGALQKKYSISVSREQIALIDKELPNILKEKNRDRQLENFSLLLKQSVPGINPGIEETKGILTRFRYTDIEEKEMKKWEKMGLSGWDETPNSFSNGWWLLFSTFVLGVGIGVLAQPQLAVRFMTVKSGRELNRGIGIGGLFILIIVGGIYVIGPLTNVYFFNSPDINTTAVAFAGGNIDEVIPNFINSAMPKWFIVIFMITLLSAAMSTISSQFHAVGSALSRDILLLGHKDNNVDKKTILWSKLGILFGTIVTVILALILGEGIIARGTAIFFGLTAASFLPLYIGGLYSRKVTLTGAVISIITGFSVSLIWMVFFQMAPAKALGICQALFGKASLVEGTRLAFVDPLVIALPLSILALIFGSLFTKKMDEQHVKYCLD